MPTSPLRTTTRACPQVGPGDSRSAGTVSGAHRVVRTPGAELSGGGGPAWYQGGDARGPTVASPRRCWPGGCGGRRSGSPRSPLRPRSSQTRSPRRSRGRCSGPQSRPLPAGACRPPVAALTHGVMTNMLLTKLRPATALVAVAALVALAVPAYRGEAGAGGAAHRQAGGCQGRPRQANRRDVGGTDPLSPARLVGTQAIRGTTGRDRPPPRSTGDRGHGVIERGGPDQSRGRNPAAAEATVRAAQERIAGLPKQTAVCDSSQGAQAGPGQAAPADRTAGQGAECLLARRRAGGTQVHARAREVSARPGGCGMAGHSDRDRCRG